MQIYFKYILSLIYSKKNKGLPPASAGWAQAGFTLIELLVSIAIASLIMTALVVQQSRWNDSLTVNSQAYELSLAIRQAQIYSLGVREDTAGSGDKFNIGYGVYFDSTNTRYIFFADRNGDQKYNSGEALETKTFTRGVTIKDVCGATNKCMFSGSNSVRTVHISFFRPEPKAIVKILTNGGSAADNPPVTITLQSLGGNVSRVKVEANGQISVR